MSNYEKETTKETAYEEKVVTNSENAKSFREDLCVDPSRLRLRLSLRGKTRRCAVAGSPTRRDIQHRR
jgi:hypothetical protein